MNHARVMLERTEALMPVEQPLRLNPREETFPFLPYRAEREKAAKGRI